MVKLQGHVKIEDLSVANGRSRIPCKREMKNLVHDCGSEFVVYRSGSSISNKIWMRIWIMNPDLTLNPKTENYAAFCKRKLKLSWIFIYF